MPSSSTTDTKTSYSTSKNNNNTDNNNNKSHVESTDLHILSNDDNHNSEELKLEPVFYDKHFDATKYTLEHLPDEITVEYCTKQMEQEQEVLDHVSQLLSDKVLRNYKAFVQGLSRVQELGKDLNMTSFICHNSRQRLRRAQDEVKGSLTILAKYRKRKQLLSCYHSLNKIKTIIEYDKMLQELLSEGEYPKAIKLMLFQKSAMSELREFDCIKSMEIDAQDNYHMIENKIDVSLIQACRSFHPDKYEKALIAYKLLGKSFLEFTEKSQQHFVDTIEEMSRRAVRSYAGHNTKYQGKAEEYPHMPFKEMCKYVLYDDLIPCIQSLFALMSEVMFNYHKMYSWHLKIEEKQKQRQQEKDANNNNNNNDGSKTTSHSNFDELTPALALAEIDVDVLRFDFQTVKDGLEHNRKSVWNNIQTKISSFLSMANVQHFGQIDAFLKLFHYANAFMEFGEEFSGSDSTSLKKGLAIISQTFFANFHREIMDRVATMFQHESWRTFEVPGDPIKGIRELRIEETTNSSAMAKSYFREHTKKVRAFLYSDDLSSNPFRSRTIDESLFSDTTETVDYEEEEESDDDAELLDNLEDDDDDGEDTKFVSMSDISKKKQKRKSEKRKRIQKSKKKEGYVVILIAYQIAKFVGTYLRAMDVLQPITKDIFVGYQNLMQFYLYVIHAFFANFNSKEVLYPEQDTGISPGLRKVFVNIRDSLDQAFKPLDGNIEGEGFRLPPREISGIDSWETCYGMITRCTAAESMVYLKNVFKTASQRLKFLMPKSHLSYVDEFHLSVEEVVEEIRHTIYQRIVMATLTLEENYVSKIANVKWFSDKDFTEHSPYVNNILKDMHHFQERIQSMGIPEELPDSVTEILYRFAVKQIMEILVEGYSRVKKCNAQGRARMGIDLQTLQNGLQSLTGLHQLPYVGYVDDYIKAFYKNQTELLDWVSKNCHRYTQKQCINLVHCGIGQQMKKKARTDVIHQIEDIYKGKSYR